MVKRFEGSPSTAIKIEEKQKDEIAEEIAF